MSPIVAGFPLIYGRRESHDYTDDFLVRPSGMRYYPELINMIRSVIDRANVIGHDVYCIIRCGKVLVIGVAGKPSTAGLSKYSTILGRGNYAFTGLKIRMDDIKAASPRSLWQMYGSFMSFLWDSDSRYTEYYDRKVELPEDPMLSKWIQSLSENIKSASDDLMFIKELDYYEQHYVQAYPILIKRRMQDNRPLMFVRLDWLWKERQLDEAYHSLLARVNITPVRSKRVFSSKREGPLEDAIEYLRSLSGECTFLVDKIDGVETRQCIPYVCFTQHSIHDLRIGNGKRAAEAIKSNRFDQITFLDEGVILDELISGVSEVSPVRLQGFLEGLYRTIVLSYCVFVHSNTASGIVYYMPLSEEKPRFITNHAIIEGQTSQDSNDTINGIIRFSMEIK